MIAYLATRAIEAVCYCIIFGSIFALWIITP